MIEKLREGTTGSPSDPPGQVGEGGQRLRGASGLRGYLRSDLRDQQPEILAPAPSSRVMSASYDNLLSSSLAAGAGNPPERKQPTRGSAPTTLW